MIALTGVAGFIGRNLAWRLAARDEKLLAVELSERLDEVTRITGRKAETPAASKPRPSLPN